MHELYSYHIAFPSSHSQSVKKVDGLDLPFLIIFVQTRNKILFLYEYKNPAELVQEEKRWWHQRPCYEYHFKSLWQIVFDLGGGEWIAWWMMMGSIITEHSHEKKLDERQWVSRGGETLTQGMDRDRCLSSVDLTRLAACQWLNMPPPAARALMLHCKRQKSWFAAHLRALFLGGVPVPLTHTHGFWAPPISTPNRRLIVLAAHTQGFCQI
jgi:hypothetical protein